MVEWEGLYHCAVRLINVTFAYCDGIGGKSKYLSSVIADFLRPIFSLSLFSSVGGLDYEILQINETFDSMDLVLYLNITIIDDDEVELSETFQVVLISLTPEVLQVETPYATVVITDNDGMYVLCLYSFRMN